MNMCEITEATGPLYELYVEGILTMNILFKSLEVYHKVRAHE
jgi:hypothetical protein